MEALLILIPLSLLAIGAAIWFFFRMSDSGQFDDMEGPAYSILLDDDSVRPTPPDEAPAAQPCPSEPAAADGTAKLTRR